MWNGHRYGYYRQRKDETGWKNSIRHNLTVHDCFVKVMRDKSKGENGKGGFWQIDEDLAQHEVDFSQRGLVRTGPGHRSKKKRKVAAKSKKSQKGGTPVKLASDDEAVSPLPQSPMSAVSAASLAGAEISADSSVRWRWRWRCSAVHPVWAGGSLVVDAPFPPASLSRHPPTLFPRRDGCSTGVQLCSLFQFLFQFLFQTDARRCCCAAVVLLFSPGVVSGCVLRYNC